MPGGTRRSSSLVDWLVVVWPDSGRMRVDGISSHSGCGKYHPARRRRDQFRPDHYRLAPPGWVLGWGPSVPPISGRGA
jgi:hypothetical protein